MLLVGIDIGGVFVKSATVKYSGSEREIVKTERNAFNFRINNYNLREALTKELYLHADPKEVDGVVVTITAETVGIFNTLEEGVVIIADICARAYKDITLGFIAVDGRIHTIEDVLKAPLDFASANWVATSSLASRFIKDGVFIDVGSTTSDIIPIVNGEVSPEGKTDMYRLFSGELIYAGLLRTYIQCLVNKLPFRNGWIGLSSELRCFTAHVYVYLRQIRELTMHHPFSGKPISIKRSEAKEAIARSVCSDSTILSDEEVYDMANYIYEQQVSKIVDSIKKIKASKWDTYVELSYVIAGSGAFLAREAVKRLGGEVVQSYDELVKDADNATAVALTDFMKEWMEDSQSKVS